MQPRSVAVIQSNYIPWKGYFDILHDADVFIFYDDVQYTKNDWRNRNKLKTNKGSTWITIPVGKRLDRLIHEVEIVDQSWTQRHWNIIKHWYGEAPYFPYFQEFFSDIYLKQSWNNLAVFNQYMIKKIATELLGIRTCFEDSRAYHLSGKKEERLIDLLAQVGATCYVSGPTAKDYLRPDVFKSAGIELVFKDYTGYPEYPQLFPPFDHYVSILDLLFQTGPSAPAYIWGWR